MNEKKNLEIDIDKEREIEDLIQKILSIKRQKDKENINETDEIKLGRRLEERSYQKLSEEILEHIIKRYEIDNNKLPSKKLLIKLMINYLGNIQKTSDNYNLCNNHTNMSERKLNDNPIGIGFHAKVYAFKLNQSQTKKEIKKLAYKKEKEGGSPYTIDIHITSAILLALYDFQPKYYNQDFMEIGKYENKSKQRSFINISYKYKINIENNIKWYILYNFTNISDQVRNAMIRVSNEELIKIDIRRLNSEKTYNNIEKYLNYFDDYRNIFFNNKEKIIKELDKLLILNEEFLIDLIKFRTERGCFNISNKELAIQIDCVSSSYKVLNLEKNEDTSLRDILKECRKVYNNLHLGTNPAFSYTLYILLKYKILEKKQYNEYIQKFNEKSAKFALIAQKIRNGESPLFINNKNKIKITKNIIKNGEKKEYKDNKNKDITIYNEKLEDNGIKEYHENAKEETKENIFQINTEENNSNIININIMNKIDIPKEKNNNNKLIINKISDKIENENNNNICNTKHEYNENIKKEYLNIKDLKNINNKNDSINNNNNKNDSINNNINNNNKNDSKNNIMSNSKKRQENNKNKVKKSSWFCCGRESVDVKD